MKYILCLVLIIVHIFARTSAHLFCLLPCRFSSSATFTITVQPCSSLSALPSVVRHLQSFCTSTLVAEAVYRPDEHAHKRKHIHECWVTQPLAYENTHCTHTSKLSSVNDQQCQKMHVLIRTCTLSFISWTHCYGILSALRCMCVYKCECVWVHGDTGEETLWVHRGIRWQTPDTHMLSHLTCPRIPAASG